MRSVFLCRKTWNFTLMLTFGSSYSVFNVGHDTAPSSPSPRPLRSSAFNFTQFYMTIHCCSIFNVLRLLALFFFSLSLQTRNEHTICSLRLSMRSACDLLTFNGNDLAPIHHYVHVLLPRLMADLVLCHFSFSFGNHKHFLSVTFNYIQGYRAHMRCVRNSMIYAEIA